MILGIDPGTFESGWCMLAGSTVVGSGVLPNHEVLAMLKDVPMPGTGVAIERVASYGMPVGREVFETCFWTGRYIQACQMPDSVLLIERKEVKLYLCGSLKAKDSNIRQSLIDLIGPQGVKKNPGPTFGVKGHAWSALSVAIVALNTKI